MDNSLSLSRNFASESFNAVFQDNDTYSPILVINYVAKPIIKKNEVLAYSFARLLGDAGGVIGIAIGASLHSFYEALISPFLTNLAKRLRII